MITRYRAWMDGEGLQDVDPSIIITDIMEDRPKERIITAGNTRLDGLRVLYRQREKTSVVIRFMIREYDVARRKAVLSKVLSWAHDGWLSISDRPDQRLRVMCDELPAINSALRWTDELDIMFTAYALPYWQEVYATTASGMGSSGTVQLSVTGDMPCRMGAEIINQGGGNVDALTLAVGGRSFVFNGLGLGAGKTLRIAYTEDSDLLTAAIDGVSVLNKRTAESADDLILQPGINQVSFTANRTIAVNVNARGLWR